MNSISSDVTCFVLLHILHNNFKYNIEYFFVDILVTQIFIAYVVHSVTTVSLACTFILDIKISSIVFMTFINNIQNILTIKTVLFCGQQRWVNVPSTDVLTIWNIIVFVSPC